MKESFEIDKSAHKKVQKKAKLRNLAKGNTNPVSYTHLTLPTICSV